MKILHINSMINGSTGHIMRDLAQYNTENEVYISYPTFDGNIKGIPRTLIIGNKFDTFIHHCLGRITGLNGCFSYFSTKKFIAKIDQLKPDIIHLHNLHNCYINIGLLFDYIKKNEVAVVWTLHDCWAFTGQCAYFDMVKCDKWKSECNCCEQLSRYPVSWFDNSRRMYQYKKKKFTGVNNLIIVTPSEWLAGLVKKSFLKEYPVKVINNGVDLKVFKPKDREIASLSRTKNKIIVLAVAFKWDKRKGFDILIDVSHNIDKEKYQIVVVGVTKKQKLLLDKNTICIQKTNSQREMSNIYSKSDVFINPTREENFCLVNIEALACGIPVITFNSGGASEAINNTCGISLKEKTSMAVLKAIDEICTKEYKMADCIMQARKYEKNKKYSEYMNLYRDLRGKGTP